MKTMKFNRLDKIKKKKTLKKGQAGTKIVKVYGWLQDMS